MIESTESRATTDLRIQRGVMIRMRDGIRLATDIYLPAGDATDLPTLVQRTPYSRDDSRFGGVKPGRIGMQDYGRYFAANGYAVVIQDVRGRYGSEGTWRMMYDDGNDGIDTLAWIAAQPWSNGKVGMFGTSYAGGTQHVVALAKAPELATVICVDAVSNVGWQGMRNHGAFELRFWNWIVTGGNDVTWGGTDTISRPALAEMSAARIEYLKRLPTRAGTTPLKHVPEYEGWLVEAMEHALDDDFWDVNNIRAHPEAYKDIPVYLVGGWYDSWDSNTTTNFRALTGALTSDVYLVMGPWIHGMQADSSHGQVSFGPEAAIKDQRAWRLQWFDRWLKDADTGVGRDAPFATKVRIFVMGSGSGRRTENGLLDHGGSWRDEHEWPLARTQLTPFYLHAGGGLSTDAANASPTATSFDFDPRDPVPSIGGNVSSAEGILVQGAWDQRGGPHIWNWTQPLPLSARNDVLVFQTEPLQSDLEVTGEIEVRLWASSTALDTDFTAKLIDVYPASEDFPGGFDLNLEDGIIRGRFRESLTEAKLMTPGEIYEFRLNLYPTSNIFKKGHRIRLDISSSNFPRFDVNPNTGEPLNQHRRLVIATNTIYHDKEHPSHVLLPVIPAGT